MNMKKGFTLIEIMIVVAIIAILAAVAIPNFLAYRAQSQQNACIANMKAIMNAEEAYSIKNNGSYTTDLSKLAEASSGNDFLKAVPKCPMGGSYTYTAATGDNQATVTCGSQGVRTGYEHVLKD